MEKYKKVKNLLNQCFNILSDNVKAQESRKYIKKAIKNLDNLIEKKQTKKNNQNKDWQLNIEAGAYELASKKIANNLKLNFINKINNLIEKEKNLLDE